MSEKPLILIVDDESKIRRLLSQNLEKFGYDTALAGDGNEALEVFSKLSPQPTLIVLDVMMPGLDGFAVLDAIRLSSSVPVIMLSAKGEHTDKIRALQKGADDYMTKPFSVDELTARIEAVLRRYQAEDRNTQLPSLENGPLRVETLARQVFIGGECCQMTDKEFQLLLVFMKHPEVVLTHDALIRTVWGAERIGDTGALRITIARLRKKLASRGLDGIITNYSGVGYIMSDLRDIED